MDIGKAFSYVFEDPNWIAKVGIGGGILLGGLVLSFLLGLPLLAAIIILMGYFLTVIKNVYEANPRPLPEWNDFGGYFMKGLYAFIGVIILQLPAIIIACCIGALTGVIGSQASSGSSDNTTGLVTTLTLCLQCVIGIYSLVIGIFMYAPLTRYALNGQLATFWDFKGNLAFIQANVGNYLIAWILSIVAGLIGEIGFALCVIPGFFTTFWAMLVSAYLFGQFARMSSGATGGVPQPPMPQPQMPQY